MKKILIITPHLSTGGQPQYLLKKIQSFAHIYDFYVIEWENITGGVLVVQRSQIEKMLGEKFISLGEEKNKIIDHINLIEPEVIHFEEIGETFIPKELLDVIYRKDRTYNIISTTHSSFTEPSSIQYTADKFILVSEWSKNKFQSYFKDEVPCEIWEYPTEKIVYDKNKAKLELGFDLGYKHVLHVGLFTPGKNQKSIIDLAKTLLKYKIKFHFVGNQAINFKDYWEPLMKDLPENCIWHGERSDVDKFYMASDVFYFPSLYELNPLAVKESLSYGLPLFLKKLHTYENTYDEVATYLSDDVHENKNLLMNHFKDLLTYDSISIVISHANTDYRKTLLENCLKSIKNPIILSVNYPVSEKIQNLCDYVFYTKENPLLYKNEFSLYNVSYNYWFIDNNGIKNITPFEYEHGFAVYSLIKNGLEIAKNLGANKVNVINYDYEINDEIFIEHNKLLDNYDLVVYYYDEKTYDDNSYCSGFFSGKLEIVHNFFNQFKDKKEYYSTKEPFNILEIKFYKYFKNKNIKIKELSFNDLSKTNKLNQEGVLQFSKS